MLPSMLPSMIASMLKNMVLSLLISILVIMPSILHDTKFIIQHRKKYPICYSDFNSHVTKQVTSND